MRERYLFALGRSGTHAVCEWMHAQGGLNYNRLINGLDQYQHGSPRPGSWLYRGELGILYGKMDRTVDGGILRCIVPICIDASTFANPAYPSSNRRTIVLLRDPYNQFASCIYQWGSPSTMMPEHHIINTIHLFAEAWKALAREFLGLTSFLPKNSVFISFNRWFSDTDYRRKLSADVGIPFNDNGINSVSVMGSSFDHKSYDGRAQDMDVFGRWRAFADQQFYRDIFDEEMRCFSESLFGTPPF